LEEDLTAIGRALFNRENFPTALVGAGEALQRAAAEVLALQGQLPSAMASPFGPPALALDPRPTREGWSTATSVAFVAASFPAARLQSPDGPALAVIAKLLRALLLHREIREKGGAYGGFASYNPEEGIFSFGSYRDPHIVTTLGVFRQAGDFLSAGDSFGQEDVKEAILQVCAEIDKPQPPGPAARKAFHRRLLGLTDEARQRFKQGVLALDTARVREAAGRCFASPPAGWGVAVIAAEERLQAANAALAPWPLHLDRI
jgi:hypothetical protein